MSMEGSENGRVSMSNFSSKDSGSTMSGVPGIGNRGMPGVGIPQEPPPPKDPGAIASSNQGQQLSQNRPLGAFGAMQPNLNVGLGRPGLQPSPPSMSVQNVVSPSVISPNDGVRVDNGINPIGGKTSVVPPPIPREEESLATPAAPEKGANVSNNKAPEKKSNFKTILIGIGAAAVVILIIFLCILAKGNRDDIEEQHDTPNQSEDVGDLVQDFQEYDDPFSIVDGDEWLIEEFTYTEEELASLRRVGYTGNEIDEFQKEERPVAELIAEAEEARKQYLDETVKPYYEARSEEFKKVEKDTWLGLPATDESQLPVTPEQLDGYTSVSKTINTDFEKVTPRGNQLFIKVYINEECTNWIYYECNPVEWSSLKDKGNVVVDVKILTYQSEDKFYEWWQAVGISIY